MVIVSNLEQKVAAEGHRAESAPIRLAKAMPCWIAFPASSDPSVGIRMLVYIANVEANEARGSIL